MPGRFDEITSHLTLDELCICISSEDEWAVRNTWFLLRAVVDEGLDYDLFSLSLDSLQNLGLRCVHWRTIVCYLRGRENWRWRHMSEVFCTITI
jgi:hypothetical protein